MGAEIEDASKAALDAGQALRHVLRRAAQQEIGQCAATRGTGAPQAQQFAIKKPRCPSGLPTRYFTILHQMYAALGLSERGSEVHRPMNGADEAESQAPRNPVAADLRRWAVSNLRYVADLFLPPICIRCHAPNSPHGVLCAGLLAGHRFHHRAGVRPARIAAALCERRGGRRSRPWRLRHPPTYRPGAGRGALRRRDARSGARAEICRPA